MEMARRQVDQAGCARACREDPGRFLGPRRICLANRRRLFFWACLPSPGSVWQWPRGAPGGFISRLPPMLVRLPSHHFAASMSGLGCWHCSCAVLALAKVHVGFAENCGGRHAWVGISWLRFGCTCRPGRVDALTEICTSRRCFRRLSIQNWLAYLTFRKDSPC